MVVTNPRSLDKNCIEGIPGGRMNLDGFGGKLSWKQVEQPSRNPSCNGGCNDNKFCVMYLDKI